MSALDLIARLREAGIRLSVQDGKIRLKAGKGVLTDELKQEIAAHKQEIIALLGQDTADNTSPLTPADRNQPLPLSYAQQRLWFLDQLEDDHPDILQMLVKQGYVEKDEEGRFLITPKGIHRVENKALLHE